MNYQIEAFVEILIRKLRHLDSRLSYCTTPVDAELNDNKAFHGGVQLTIRIEVFVIKVELVRWMINLMEDFNFNYDLSISRYLLDPKRNEIDEIPKEFQFHSNDEFYLTISPSKTKIKGRFISLWDSNGYGWHISNANYYFEDYQKGDYVLRQQPQSILPAQMN